MYKVEGHIFKITSEFVRRYLCVSPLLIAASIEGGWYELACTYSCLLVGSVCLICFGSGICYLCIG